MGCRNEEFRQVVKITDVAGDRATIPVSDDHSDGSWLATDIYPGEFLLNTTDGTLEQRDSNGIVNVFDRGASLYKLKRTFTQAEIQALFSSQQDIISAPGANKMVVPVLAFAKLKHNGTTYTSGNRLKIKYKGDADAEYLFQSSAALVNAVADRYERLSIASKQDLQVNTGISAFIDNADPTGNGGTIDLFVFYQIINFG